jgi:hypothetical protein
MPVWANTVMGSSRAADLEAARAAFASNQPSHHPAALVNGRMERFSNRD